MCEEKRSDSCFPLEWYILCSYNIIGVFICICFELVINCSENGECKGLSVIDSLFIFGQMNENCPKMNENRPKMNENLVKVNENTLKVNETRIQAVNTQKIQK